MIQKQLAFSLYNHCIANTKVHITANKKRSFFPIVTIYLKKVLFSIRQKVDFQIW